MTKVDSIKIQSDITVFMKYARYLSDKQRRENWKELCYRDRDMLTKKYPELHSDIVNVFNKFVIPKKVLPSMRSMQFAGKAIEVNPVRIFNCSYLPVDHYKAFSETMFLLLSGTGVGYSVQGNHVGKLPIIRKPLKSRRYLIEDSIAGWADAVKRLMGAYMLGKSLPIFDFGEIREKGAMLITSGGKAPGPEPLLDCLHNLKKVLDRKKDGDKLTPLECHDIQCFIADCVLSGGIRRAACISFFDISDNEMLSCKTGSWWELNPQRGRANNSAVLLRHRITKEVFFGMWKKIEASGSGEPAFYLTNDADKMSNPCCFTGDTLIKTSEGFKEISSLVGKDIKLYNKDRELHQGSVWSTGIKDTIILRLENSECIKCTPEHTFLLDGHIESEAQDTLGEYIMTLKGLVKVVGIRIGPKVEVYDFNINDGLHWGVIGNSEVIAHNCEISLNPFQLCNLTEINMSNLESQKDFNERSKAASFLGTLQAGFTDFYYLRDIWKKTTEKEALIGVSGTGICSGEVLKYDCKEASEVVVAENERVADLIGINKAARCTAIKPSGTTSLVLGTSSGIHAWYAPYYIRRIRVGKNESMYGYLRDNHPELIEDEFFNPDTQAVISIPIKAPTGGIFRDESPIEMLERVKKFSTEWIKPGHRSGSNTHNVSATVSLKDDEWKEVGDWMWKNREYYNGLSVLPYDGGTYIQAPFEEITKYKYDKMIGSLSKVNLDKIVELDDNTDLAGEIACSGLNGCEIK